MKCRWIIYATLLIGLWTTVSVHAEDYVFRSLSLSANLSDLLVNAIYKDSDGYIWLGTGNSLDRFDGTHLKHYPLTAPDEKLKRVNAVVETADHRIWMGNGTGLWQVDRKTDALTPAFPEQIKCEVYTFCVEETSLYIGTEKGLFILQADNSLEQVWLDSIPFAAANKVRGICKGENRLLWLATEKGLYSLNLDNRKVTSYHNIREGEHSCAFNCIARIGHKLYLGTMNRGIVEFDTGLSVFSSYVDVGCNVISTLSTDGVSLLYVGTDGNGVHFIDTKRRAVVRSFRHEPGGGTEGLRSNSVYSLLVDRDGLIWVGFYQNGLDYTLFQNALFNTYALPGLFDTKDMPVRAILIRGGVKLIGSRDGLFYIDENRHIVRSYQTPQMRSGMVFCLQYYEGKYWVGTYGGGMYTIDPATQELHDFSTDADSPFYRGHVFCMDVDEAGSLWIGTSDGLYCYRDGKLTDHFTSVNSQLPDGNVYEICFDSTGKGWICTENGLCLWEPSSARLRTDVFPEGFIHHQKIRVVFEDSKRRLYFFPDKGELFVSDLAMNRFRSVSSGTPLEGKDGQFIVEDAWGSLWLGTTDGLFRKDAEDNFVPYTFVDGVPSPVFTLCQPVVDEQNRLWLGNTRGLIYTDSDRLMRQKKMSYPVQVTEIYVNGRPHCSPWSLWGGEERLHFSSQQTNITFCISDFTYTFPGYCSFEYRLDGRDDEWKELTENPDVYYYNLPSGTYTFRVRQTGKPDTEVQLSLEIAHSPWMWIFTIGILVVLLGIVAARVLGRKDHSPVDSPVLRPQAAFAGKSAPVVPMTDAASADPASLSVAAEPLPAALTAASNSETDFSAGDGKTAADKYKTVRLTPDECDELVRRLGRLMDEKKVYTNGNLKLSDLADMLDVSGHTLSYLFNFHLKRNYYDYVNDYRIAEFKWKINSEDCSKYTLNALAESCGFSSRSSFFRYFKKAEGITPSEYIRKMGKQGFN